MPAATAKSRVSEGLSRYQAITHVSVPQRVNGVRTEQNDLVEPGEYCYLTEDEARNLMATGGRTGRQRPAVRPAAEGGDPLPQILPRLMSGSLRGPNVGVRPDPQGSSQLLDLAPATDNGGDGNSQGDGDDGGQALDIPPTGAGAAAAMKVAAGQG